MEFGLSLELLEMRNGLQQFLKLFFISLLFLGVVSCINPQTSITTNSTPFAVVTPEITATPILFNSSTQDLIPILSETYHRSISCLVDNKSEIPNNATGFVKPELIDIINNDQSSILVDEIADNSNNTYRAYLVDVCNKDANCTYQLHLENKVNGQRNLVIWEGFEAMTAHWNLIWIGEDIIAYMHLLDPRREEIIAIDVKTKEFAYVGQTWAECVEP